MKTIQCLTFGILSAALLLSAVSCSSGRGSLKVSSTAPTVSVAEKKATSGKAAPATRKDVPAADTAATEEVDEYATAEVNDPWEGLNRFTFKVNDKIYTVVMRPVGKGYEFIIPKPARKGITNAFDNVKFPVRFVNCALQGKFKRAGQETGMFLVNTVAGVGGLFKVSNKIEGLKDVPLEDSGQTLAKWGIGHGPYFVLPVFGPCSVRDTVGWGADYCLNPINWGIFWKDGGDWKRIPPAVNTVQLIPTNMELYDTVTENAVDPYISARSFYIQNRNHESER